MVLHVAKGSFSDDVEHISFPTEVDKVRNEVIAVEEFGSWAPAYVIGGDGAAKVPASYIERDALFSEAGVQKLNQLAGLVDTMDLEAQKVFAGARRSAVSWWTPAQSPASSFLPRKQNPIWITPRSGRNSVNS